MAIARYFGGKGGDALQKWITSYFPPPDQYQAFLDPFCGLGSILLAKKKYYPSPFNLHREILSDQYSPNIGLLIQVRERPIQLVVHINTLLSELNDIEKLKEWVRSYCILQVNGYASYSKHPDNDPEVLKGVASPENRCQTRELHQGKSAIQLAAEYWLYCQCSFRGGGLRWNCGASPSQCQRYADPDFRVRVKPFEEWSAALKNVELRWMDGLEVLNIVLDGTPQRFIYCDPPYPMEVRKSKDNRHKDKVKALSRRQYAVEFDDEQHEQLRKKLDGTLSLVSSYPSDLYRSLYQGWLMVVYQPKRQRQIIYRDQPPEDSDQFEDIDRKKEEKKETPECLYISPELEKVLQLSNPDLLKGAVRVGDKII